MTIFLFYCPACGESSQLEQQPDTYELAPGTEIMECPACLTRFNIEIEYIPFDDEGPDIERDYSNLTNSDH